MTPRDFHIGKHIRRLRKTRGSTLQEVADICGFSRSLLSKIETGKVIPAVGTLAKIANSLGTTVSALLENGRTVDARATKWQEAVANFTQNERGENISPIAVEIKDKKMQPFYFRIRRGEQAPRIHSHDGEEFIFVFEGVIRFRAGHIEYTLEKGDSIYYRTVEEHMAIAETEVATAVIVFI